jgi:lysophospholipase L1-like esterase
MTKRRMNHISSSSEAASGVLLLLLLCPTPGCNNGHLLMPDPAVRYLAFGDSSTAGSSGRGYPEILYNLLGQPAGTIANQGSGGETAGAGLDRLRQLLSRRIYPNANTLLYWEGGVDLIDFIREADGLLLFSPLEANYPYSTRLTQALDQIQADIESAITAGQQAGLTAYVATYFSLREATAECQPMFLEIILPSQARTANAYIALLNERIRQAAVNTGAVLVDIASADDALHADDSNFVNCNHLSDRGNAVVAQLFVEALNR